MKSAITLCLFPEAKGGPFVLWEDLDEGFRKAARFGFDAVELFPGSPGELDFQKVKDLATRHSLRISAIGTGAGWVKHKLRLTDPDPGIRKAARQFVGGIIDLAAKLETPAIIGSMQGRWEGATSRAQAVDWLAEALEELGPLSEALEVPLLYEPLNRYETNLFNRVDESIEFLGALRTQNVKLLCDLFHMNIEEPDIPSAIRRADRKLGHVHFADSNRRAIGMGHLDMKPIMAALVEVGFDGYLSAEVSPCRIVTPPRAKRSPAFEVCTRAGNTFILFHA